MKARFELKPGHELRGLMIRLYPTKEHVELLEILETDSRRAWNWLVKGTEEVLQARAAFALRHGLVGPRPVRPEYEGLSPDESKAAKQKHREACAAWHKTVYETTNKLPQCSFRKLKELQEHFRCKYDYQLLAKVIAWGYEGAERRIKPNAHLLQALTKNYFTHGKNQRRKKFRKSFDPMPLQVRSGDCFEMGEFGSRGSTHSAHKGELQVTDCTPMCAPTHRQNFYNCRITFNGLKIRGRLPGKEPGGRVLEGVSIVKKADGWWASVKVEVPIREVTPAIPGTMVGIDVGLDFIAAISEVRVVEKPGVALFEQMGPTLEGHERPRRVANDRGKEYAERIAGRQAQKKPVGRLQLQAQRHTLHVIYNEIVKPLAFVETIKIEKLSSKIGQMGSAKTSAMRTAAGLLQQRYGTRVREVEPHYTSQDCSQCGFRSKDTWSYAHGRIGVCPKCGHEQDRDINASRNVAAKPAIPLAA